MSGPMDNSDSYLAAIRPLLGRALSGLDAEPTSPTHGSFDRTWWCWKFTDFSATRFQEGAHLLGWLASSPRSPAPVEARGRMTELAGGALRFWTRLQHSDGSFDEAYPFERSLAATAFTGFYLGIALERIRDRVDQATELKTLSSIERGATWLANNGEHHGILSNHLAASAAALQVAGDVIGTDKFKAARDRYLGVIYKHQHPDEGWMKEYGGADPGYQSHGMFYLAEIERRTGDKELFGRLIRASDFVSWFAHPDGSLGGEYASRGTKFAYPAAFEMLAARVPSSAAVAKHMRERLSAGRGVGAQEMDAWNQFPLLNNLLFAADAAGDLSHAAELPWRTRGAVAVFADAGLAIANANNRIVAMGGQMGGSVKLFEMTGALIYEDCGYAVASPKGFVISQGEGRCQIETDRERMLHVDVETAFRGIPSMRFDPWRFVAFRLFTTTLGRFPVVSRWLKDLLVTTLIRKKKSHPGRLHRRISVAKDGKITIEDRITGVSGAPIPVPRHVPFHMGSSRYADFEDWCGAHVACKPAKPLSDGSQEPPTYHRHIELT